MVEVTCVILYSIYDFLRAQNDGNIIITNKQPFSSIFQINPLVIPRWNPQRMFFCSWQNILCLNDL